LSGAVSADVLLPLAVAMPLLGAVAVFLLGRLAPRVVLDAATALVALATVADLFALWALVGSGHATSWLGGWRMRNGHSVGIVLVGDRLGVGLAALVAVLVLAVVAYAWRYFDEPPRGQIGAFPALLLLFEAGMCGFALTGDLFNAFVFFELMGVAAYALTGFRIEDPRPLQGALTFAVVNSFAAYATLLGIGMLYARTGELGFAQIGARLSTRPTDALIVVAFALVMVSMLVKAAIVPFHFWLPDAHAVAPTPVCMLLSGVMVELGGYGVARVYWTVFAGPGGVPRPTFQHLMVAAGALTALVGCVMCWQQRHLKRLLAFSTISHSGLFLLGLGLLLPQATAGTALYIAGHACAKAAPFGLTGVLLDRHGSVDEHSLHGRGRHAPVVGVLFALSGLALAGMPPFGLGLGKAVAEHAAGAYAPWLPALFVLVGAVTGGAVLRATLRVFAGAGPRPRQRENQVEITGDAEEPEVRSPTRTVPWTMTAVPGLLLGCCLLLGVLPAVGRAAGVAAGAFTDRTGYLAAVFAVGAPPAGPSPTVDWTLSGVLLGLLGTALAVALGCAAVWGPAAADRATALARRCAAATSRWAVQPVRRLHSGHLGDYLAWLMVGLAVLLAAAGARI
jgi:multicomponent Na+:H+ antiporter subunit D